MKILLGREVYLEELEAIKKFGYEVITSFDHELNDEELKDVEIIIGNVDPSILKRTPNLKFFQTSSAGSDNYAFLDEIKNKVILCNGTGCFSDSISEWVIGIILYFFKNLNIIIPNQTKHFYYNPGETRGIINSKVLIIGCGDIGMTIARKLNALGAIVTGIKKTPANKPEYLEALYTNEKIDEIISDFDIVIMSLPQNNETKKLMNKERLNKLKEKSLLINVGRGSAIDTDALIDILKSKKIYCALDVFEKEPLEKDSPLWDLENLLITPHVTGNETLAYTRKKINELALYNLDAYINNKPMKNVVDFSTGYKKSNSL